MIQDCVDADRRLTRFSVTNHQLALTATDRAAAQAVRAAGFRGASIIIGQPLEADPADLRRLKAALDEAIGHDPGTW